MNFAYGCWTRGFLHTQRSSFFLGTVLSAADYFRTSFFNKAFAKTEEAHFVRGFRTLSPTNFVYLVRKLGKALFRNV